jgi:hypothetical protein
VGVVRKGQMKMMVCVPDGTVVITAPEFARNAYIWE